MNLKRLFSLRRLLGCRRVFRSPLQAHMRLAFVTSASRKSHVSIGLEFLNGGAFDFPHPGRWTRVWDLILDHAPAHSPVAIEDGLMTFYHEGCKITLRPGTADGKVFKVVCLQDEYRLGTIDPELGTVIDLGSNIGLFAALISKRARRVIAVEPVSDNLRIAAANIAGAGNEEKVTLLACAICGTSGEKIKIYMSPNDTSSNSLSKDFALVAKTEQEAYEEVESLSLDDLFKQQQVERCSLLKCDVEGAEYDIILNASLETLRKIDAIAMEVHIDVSSFPIEKFHELLDRLRQAGFSFEYDAELDSPSFSRHGAMLFARR